MRTVSSIALFGLAAACATGETPMLGDSMDPSALGGSGGSEAPTGGSIAESGSSGTSGASPMGGTFSTGGEVAGGTFSTGGLVEGGTFGSSGSPSGGGGTGGSGGSGGTASGGSGGSGGTASGGSGGMPPNGTCGQNPIGPKDDWTATASIHADNCENPADPYCGPPERGIDGIADNRYTTGAPRTGNEWYQIDFGEIVAVSRLVLNTAAGSGDYTLQYEVRMADTEDAVASSASIADGNGQQGTTTVSFPSPKTGRFLRISQTMAMSGWWSLAEVDVTCQ